MTPVPFIAFYKGKVRTKTVMKGNKKMFGFTHFSNFAWWDQYSEWLHLTLRNMSSHKTPGPNRSKCEYSGYSNFGTLLFVWQHLTSNFMHSHTVQQHPKMLAHRELRWLPSAHPQALFFHVSTDISPMSKVHRQKLSIALEFGLTQGEWTLN